MTHITKIKKICSRGHVFYKSSDCKTCPTCWHKTDRIKYLSDFPKSLPAPALRALHAANIKSLSDVTKWSQSDVAALHGIGPIAIRELKKVIRFKSK